MRHFVLALILSACACAQPFSAGIKAGVPLTDAISLTSQSCCEATGANGNYVIGPYVELHLPAKISLEVDALYRSFSYFSEGSTPSGANQHWEFPVVAKYKLLSGPIKPYIEGGLVFAHLNGSDFSLAHSNNLGIVLGAGVEIHAAVLRISPEIRYDGFVFHDFVNNSFFQSNRNQVMVLVGIGF